jgi:enoyl-CoA hydratase/carnithine racemase
MEKLSMLQRSIKDSDYILKERRGNCFKIILNRPKQLNTIGSHMQLELLQAIEEANQTSKVCILKSTTTGKVFCVGGDVKELSKLFMSSALEEGFMQYYKVIFEMARSRPITIAFWDGIVMGAGAGLSTNCNIKIATENTMFAMPEAKLGYFTDAGASHFLSRLRKNIGLFLAMTSYSLKGEEAFQVGVADYFVKSKNLPALEADIETVSQIPTVNEAVIRETIEKYSENIFKTYDGEDIIAELFEGQDVSEILEKLKQESQENGRVQKWYQAILQNCPLSHYYNYELLKRGKTINIHEALSLETYLAKRVNLNDFFEGIRSVLIEKGTKPNWSVNFEDLKNQKAEVYFPKEIKLIDYQGKSSISVKFQLESFTIQ